MLLAVMLWAAAHLLANGSLADVLLFGSFFIWALADRVSAGRRTVPRRVPGAPPSTLNDVAALVAGLLVYVGFLFWAHAWVTGVPLLG